MIKLEKGAPVRVRLHTGEVVEARYRHESFRKQHYVTLPDGREIPATKYPPKLTDWFPYERVRFVGAPCVLVPVGVSV